MHTSPLLCSRAEKAWHLAPSHSAHSSLVSVINRGLSSNEQARFVFPSRDLDLRSLSEYHVKLERSPGICYPLLGVDKCFLHGLLKNQLCSPRRRFILDIQQ